MATILLTSISFRSTITSKLPVSSNNSNLSYILLLLFFLQLTSYLTLIDKYSITLIVFDLTCTVYHAIMGYWINSDKSVDVKLKSRLPDHIMSFILLSLFLLVNLIFFIWIIRVAYKPRRILQQQIPWTIMDKKDSFSSPSATKLDFDRI